MVPVTWVRDSLASVVSAGAAGVLPLPGAASRAAAGAQAPVFSRRTALRHCAVRGSIPW